MKIIIIIIIIIIKKLILIIIIMLMTIKKYIQMICKYTSMSVYINLF